MAADLDWNTVLARFDLAVDTLTTAYVAEGFRLDRDQAERSRAFIQAKVEGYEGDDQSNEALIRFWRRHGLSFDWLFEGDVTVILCQLAAQRAARA